MNKILTFFVAATLVPFAVVQASESDSTSTSTTATTSTTASTYSSANGPANREAMGMPMIIEMALREQHKVPESIIEDVNCLVLNAFLEMQSTSGVSSSASASPSTATTFTTTTSTTTSTTSTTSTTTTTPTTSDQAIDISEITIEAHELDAVIQSFKMSMVELANKAPEGNKAMISGLLKEELSKYIRASAPLNTYYRQAQSKVPIAGESDDVHKRIIEAMSLEWRTAEKLLIMADDKFRDGLLWIDESEYKQAVTLSDVSFRVYQLLREMIPKFYGDEVAQKVNSKELHEAFVFDNHIMQQFYNGLKHFKSVLKDANQEGRVLEPINAAIAECTGTVADFKELAVGNLATLQNLDLSEKSQSAGLPYALSTYLELSASSSLKSAETNVIAAQTKFLDLVKAKKVPTQAELTAVIAKEMPALMAACGITETDKFREPLVTWMTGWYWTTACGAPLKAYRYERLLQHSPTDDLHLYTKLHESHYAAIMKLASEKTASPNSQLALLRAAHAFQHGLMAVQRAFMSCGFVKMLPASDLYKEHFVPIMKKDPNTNLSKLATMRDGL